MNITSMLSDGYLQPQRESLRSVDSARDAAQLAAQEQQVLVQEQALKTSSGPDAKVSTTYRYSVGPDGRRYISGASVSIKGGEENSAAPGANAGKEVELGEKAESPKDDKTDKVNEANKKSGSDESDKEVEAQVRELRQVEQEVIRHEAAHQAAAGGLGGGVSYTYTKGPDGKNYISGGEVPINMPSSDDPEQTLRDMQKVQRAALAPANPSGQDVSVAGKAAAKAAAARQELAAQNGAKISEGSEADDADADKLASEKSGGEKFANAELENLGYLSHLSYSPNENKNDDKEESSGFSSGVSSVKAGLLFGRLQEDSPDSLQSAGLQVPSFQRKEQPRDGYVLSVVAPQRQEAQEQQDSAAADLTAAYGLSASGRGLWTLANGFDPSQKREEQREALKPFFSVAA